MAIVISRSEIERMKKNHLPDCDTEFWGMGLTEFDIFEHNHSDEDWEIIEDIEESNKEEDE